MRIDRFEPKDMDEITLDFREAFIGSEYLPYISPEAFTFRSMGEVISIVGINQFHDGVYMAWAFQYIRGQVVRTGYQEAVAAVNEKVHYEKADYIDCS